MRIKVTDTAWFDVTRNRVYDVLSYSSPSPGTGIHSTRSFRIYDDNGSAVDLPEYCASIVRG